jgi:xylulokinase
MWVEALDLLLQELRDAGVDFGRVRAISGAGQQHGSVYLAKTLDSVGDWSVAMPLAEQVRPLLSRKTSPIWMDSSTSADVRKSPAPSAVTSAWRRFPARAPPCVSRGHRFVASYKTSPAEWQRTAEIHLVSSFMASLLIGKSASIDLGDGAGMNLLDLEKGAWSEALLEATAPGLRQKLKPAVASTSVVGEVAGYFVKKYGFAPGTKVVAFTGDNPSSLIGMGASKPGTAVISLGTSDTVFTAMAAQRTDPRGYGSVFGNPAGGFMSLACFSNGSLAREEITRRFGLSWDDFARAIVEQTKPGNGGNVLLPYFVPEITPRVLRPRRAGSAATLCGRAGRGSRRARRGRSPGLSMRLHSDWIGEKMHTILVTGGASRNRGLLRVLADVFQATIMPLPVSNASALGGALRAAQAVEGCAGQDLYTRFAPPERA